MINRVELPKGFLAAGVNSGVRKYRPDVGVLYSSTPCAAAGVYTTNSLKAWPVYYNQALLPSDSIKAIVVNSGQANVGTGVMGKEDNLFFASRMAEELKIKPQEVLTASTGMIGERMQTEKIFPSLSGLVRGLSDALNNFCLAIMTTDVVPKASRKEIELSEGKVVIAGCSKGSGMIHPNMATMLAFVVTDVKVDSKYLHTVLKECADSSFNMISVDHETSTNDMVLALANGASGVSLKNKDDQKKFHDAFLEVLTDLSIQIARDGEGATKLITVQVDGASSLDEARRVARSVTVSPLVKSAVHGEDPNWGRVLARIGMMGVEPQVFEKMSLHLQGICVYSDGAPQKFDRAECSKALRSENTSIIIDMKNGKYSATAWGCDLTKRYVEINTAYS